MATIKSYTDLKQSKVLADILPLESADMCYVIDYAESNKYGTDHFKLEVDTYGLKVQTRDNIPCWSLAALISILPRSIEFKDDKYYLRFMKDYVEYANDEVSITGRCLHTTGNNNLVDASYEMILKLHELKMLNKC